MDPKMDSGYLASGQSLEDEYDVSRSLLPQEVLGIMDQLLGQEVRSKSDIAVQQRKSTILIATADGLAYGQPVITNVIYISLLGKAPASGNKSTGQCSVFCSRLRAGSSRSSTTCHLTSILPGSD